GHPGGPHRPLLELPREAPVGRHEDAPPEGAARLVEGRRRALGVAAAKLLHRRQPEVVLGALPHAPPALAGEGHAGTGAGAGVRRAASPFWAAMAMGSKSAPMGGE